MQYYILKKEKIDNKANSDPIILLHQGFHLNGILYAIKDKLYIYANTLLANRCVKPNANKIR